MSIIRDIIKMICTFLNCLVRWTDISHSQTKNIDPLAYEYDHTTEYGTIDKAFNLIQALQNGHSHHTVNN